MRCLHQAMQNGCKWPLGKAMCPSTHETDLVIPYQAKIMGFSQAEAVIGNLPQKPLKPEDKWVSTKMDCAFPKLKSSSSSLGLWCCC